MLKNNLKVAWRNLKKQKLYSLINVLGLTVGLSSFLLIYIYLHDELTYDKFHPDHDKIYKMSYLRKSQTGDVEAFATSGTTWAPRYKEIMPEVEDFVLMTHAGYPGYIKKENDVNVFMEPGFKWATENFYQFFNFELVKGHKETVLSKLNAVVLTETSAQKYFGSQDPMGQTLIYNVSGGEINLTVTGVMKDPPENSHIKPDFIGNIKQVHQHYMQLYEYNFLQQDDDAFAFTYLKVSDARVLDKIADDWKNYMKEAFANSENNQADRYQEAKFTAMADIHFVPEMKWELEAPVNSSYIPIFSITAILVLVIACINFMNLATARSAKRAKEIGLRKTMGSTKKQLIAQFYAESFLMTIVALVLSFVVIAAAMPMFNTITDKVFTVSAMFNWQFGGIVLLLIFVVGIVSGSYPALYLSSFNPMAALRGTFNSGKDAEMIRKGLVVFQFAVSITLIICTLVVNDQLQLINNTSLGKDKDRLLSIRLGGFGLGDRYSVFRDQIEMDSRFEGVSVANHLPRLPHFGQINNMFTFPSRNNEEIEWNKFDVDFNFPSTFDLEFLAGRDFSKEIRSDSNAIVLNQAAVNDLGLSPLDVIGMTIQDRVYSQQLQQRVQITGKVIGVVEDFPYKSVNTEIEPLVIWGSPSPYDRILYVKMTPNQYDEKLAFLRAKWKELIPGLPMENWFMDFEFGRLYKNERKMSSIFILFSTITIMIAILGLFALTSYVIEQRKKEIGVRKVLGASEGSLVGLLLKHFFILVGLAFVIAAPLAWFMMNSWLRGFIYRVDVSIFIILLSGLAVAIITLITVGFDTYKAAIANPVKTLRTD